MAMKLGKHQKNTFLFFPKKIFPALNAAFNGGKHNLVGDGY